MEQRQTIAIEVEDKPGVLTRISSLFSRRGFNIESLTVGHTHTPGISRFTIVVKGDGKVLEQIRKQTQKLIHIVKSEELEISKSITREFTVIKLEYDRVVAPEINRVIDFYGGRMLDHFDGYLVVEFSGSEEKIDTIFHELKDTNILESIRTGKVGMKVEK
ncbi:MAG: acetolactate synthase-1/3 small subunit [bacterium]|jgi:acetolactate synthase-1/3 small subunit